MLTHVLTAAILASALVCAADSVGPGTDTQAPTDKQPPDDEQQDQHFCCQSVDPKNWTGDGCSAISSELINSCQHVLYCPGKWTKSDGTVTCD